MGRLANALIVVASGVVVAMFAGCGGGGGGDSGGQSVGPGGQVGPRTYLTGTVAAGEPVFSVVWLTCGSGGRPGFDATSSDPSDGGYRFDIGENVFWPACHAPYTLTAGDVTWVEPTDVAPGSTRIVNLTPVSRVIAKLLPEASESNVSEVKAVVMNALANMLTSAGESPSFDPIHGKLVADNTKFDRVLDNLQVDISPSGIVMTNISAAKMDDMAAIPTGSTAPALPSGSQVSSTRDNFHTALGSPLAAGLDNVIGIKDSIAGPLERCFELPSAQRGTLANPASACAGILASDYLNDGRTGSEEFDQYLTDSNLQTIVREQTQVLTRALYWNVVSLRLFSPQRALVTLNATRPDGSVVATFRSVVENSPATGNVWELRGNQRPYSMSVQPAQKELPAPDKSHSSLATGLTLLFDAKAGHADDKSAGTQTGVSYVRVRGPALPEAGVVLRPGPSGCDDSYVIAASPPPAALPASQACSGDFWLATKASTIGASDPMASRFGAAPDFAAAPLSDIAIFSTLRPMSGYTFEVHRMNGTVVTFVERLPRRVTELQEINT